MPTAFEDAQSIHATTYPKVYRYFYYRDFIAGDCEECCQEVFMRFFQRYGRESFDDSRTIRTLMIIAKNVWREHLRALGKHASWELFDTDLLEGEEWLFFDEELQEVDNVALHSEIEKALGTLNPSVRQVIELRYLEGLTRREVAEKLQISEKQVHVYQRRGVQYLQRQLGTTVTPSA